MPKKRPIKKGKRKQGKKRYSEYTPYFIGMNKNIAKWPIVPSPNATCSGFMTTC